MSPKKYLLFNPFPSPVVEFAFRLNRKLIQENDRLQEENDF